METPSRRNNVENVTQPNTLLETPPSGIEITPQDIIGNSTVEASPNRKPRVALKLTAGVAALLAAGGATAYALGIGRDNPQEGTRPVPAATGDPSGEVSPNPVETSAPSEGSFEVIGLPKAEQLEVKSDQSDEAIARGFVEDFSLWGMAGANKDMETAQNDSDNIYLSLAEYSKKIAEASAPLFISSIYGDYANNEDVKASLEKEINYNAQILETHFQTYGSQNEETFYQKIELVSLDSIINNPDGTVTYELSLVQRANGDKTIVNGSNEGFQMNGVMTVDKSKPVAHLSKPIEITPKQ